MCWGLGSPTDPCSDTPPSLRHAFNASSGKACRRLLLPSEVSGDSGPTTNRAAAGRDALAAPVPASWSTFRRYRSVAALAVALMGRRRRTKSTTEVVAAGSGCEAGGAPVVAGSVPAVLSVCGARPRAIATPPAGGVPCRRCKSISAASASRTYTDAYLSHTRSVTTATTHHCSRSNAHGRADVCRHHTTTTPDLRSVLTALHGGFPVDGRHLPLHVAVLCTTRVSVTAAAFATAPTLAPHRLGAGRVGSRGTGRFAVHWRCGVVTAIIVIVQGPGQSMVCYRCTVVGQSAVCAVTSGPPWQGRCTPRIRRRCITMRWHTAAGVCRGLRRHVRRAPLLHVLRHIRGRSTLRSIGWWQRCWLDTRLRMPTPR